METFAWAAGFLFVLTVGVIFGIVIEMLYEEKRHERDLQRRIS